MATATLDPAAPFNSALAEHKFSNFPLHSPRLARLVQERGLVASRAQEFTTVHLHFRPFANLSFDARFRDLNGREFYRRPFLLACC